MLRPYLSAILVVFLNVFAGVAMTGCGDKQEQTNTPLPEAERGLALSWADLMPPGEEQRLEEAYADYFNNLDLELTQNQTMMTAMGPGSIDSIEEGSEQDFMPQLGTFNTVADLDGLAVRIPGFVVPLDYAKRGVLKNFLFVPYFGACIHTPPPPPNQIVFVEGEVSFSGDDIYEPYWADGIMTISSFEHELGRAAYTLKLRELSPYDY